jgi:hypothetical protein
MLLDDVPGLGRLSEDPGDLLDLLDKLVAELGCDGFREASSPN